MKKIGVIVGSLRKESYNRKVAEYMVAHMPEGYEAEIMEIADLPLYNPDLDKENIPAPWAEFRQAVREKDAFLFVTPEYNRSIPAAIKNAVDIGSRPPSNQVWDGKAAAVISASPGKIGGFGSNKHLNQSLASLNMLLMPNPEVYLSEIHKAFNEKGELEDARTKTFFEKVIQAFIQWIDRF